MKKAFIVYFEDKSAVVIIASDIHDALSSLLLEDMHVVSRVELIPFKVL